jgi:ribosomal protein S18 acetylase RimI-like enzyme
MGFKSEHPTALFAELSARTIPARPTVVKNRSGTHGSLGISTVRMWLFKAVPGSLSSNLGGLRIDSSLDPGHHSTRHRRPLAFPGDRGVRSKAEAAKVVPIVAAHLTGWRRCGDFGFIAGRDGVVVGAAWARQSSPEEQPALYFGECTSEISIAVEEHVHRLGVGQELLSALIAEAARRGVCLRLRVRQDNPALRLYERMRFRIAPGATVPNRVGSLSPGMLFNRSDDRGR